jgi:hypothetical protein
MVAWFIILPSYLSYSIVGSGCHIPTHTPTNQFTRGDTMVNLTQAEREEQMDALISTIEHLNQDYQDVCTHHADEACIGC